LLEFHSFDPSLTILTLKKSLYFLFY
jgi:hypothetical protein